MKKSITFLLDQEQFNLLKNLQKARRETNVSRIIREALWCYGEKILLKNATIEAKEKKHED